MSKTNPTAREVFITKPFLNKADRFCFEENLFKRLRMSNGLDKTTWMRRFDDVNELLLKLIADRWAGESVNILDVAVSSGVSTVELAKAMRRAGFAIKIVGTDVSNEATLLSYGRPFHVLYNRKGKALQFEILGFPVANYAGKGITFLRRGLPVLACRALFHLLNIRFVRRLAAPSSEMIRLITDECQNDPDITIIEEDLFHPGDVCSTYHVVRAANILKPEIFSNVQLAQAIDKLRRRLKPGGILILVRTKDEDRTNHGCCYELRPDGTFRQLQQVGRGCDVERFVLAGRDQECALSS
jgi:hypothetical protein